MSNDKSEVFKVRFDDIEVIRKVMTPSLPRSGDKPVPVFNDA